MLGMLLNVVHRQIDKNISKKTSDGLHDHSTLLVSETTLV